MCIHVCTLYIHIFVGNVDIMKKSKQFGLDAVSVIFLGTDIGSLKGSEEGEAVINEVSTLLELAGDLIHIPKWMLDYHPKFKKLVHSFEATINRVKIIIDRDLHRAQKNENTIISKLVTSCGGNTSIPTTFAVDAINAGADTTGNSAIFLLYHLARNPEKQELLHSEICQTIGQHGNLNESALAKVRKLYY